MLGDSTANSLGWALRGLRKPGLVVDLFGKDGCTMLADTCDGETWAEHADGARVAVVFLGGAFLHGVSSHGRWRKPPLARHNGQPLALGSPERVEP